MLKEEVHNESPATVPRESRLLDDDRVDASRPLKVVAVMSSKEKKLPLDATAFATELELVAPATPWMSASMPVTKLLFNW